MPADRPMSTPHDALFCQVFSDPRHAEGELRALLPADIGQQVAWHTLERLPATYKDVAHGDRHADLLFGVEIGGEPALLYLLLEHKSASDRRTALQLLGYVFRILQQYDRENPLEEQLPPILAMVVYHGARGWRRGTELLDLFRLNAVTGPLLAPYLPQLRFLLDDLSKVTPDELAARTQTAMAHLVLGCLQRLSEGGDLGQVIRDLQGVFHAARTAADTGALLAAVLSYIARVRDLAHDDLRAIIRVELGPDLEQDMTSTYDQLINEGRQQGLAQGLAQGKAETLLRMIGKRFGEPSTEIVARVQAADVETLDRWVLRFVDAGSLDEVFADD